MLTPEHRDFLRRQGVKVELAEELGVRSLLSRADNPADDAWENWANFPAILFPWVAPDGRVEYQARPDNPTLDARNRPRKYVFRKGMMPVLWAVRPVTDDTETFLIVEGTKQALAAASYARPEVAVYAIAGCRSWQKDKAPIPDLAEALGYDVVVCLDADASTKAQVYNAGVMLEAALRDARASSVLFTRLSGDLDAKAGLDDVLGGLKETGRAGFLAELIEGAKAAPADAPPKGAEEPAQAAVAASAWLDLGRYLDDDYEPVQPSVGATRSDGRALLYAGKSHLLVGETGIGKSWFACYHVAVELLAGNTVVYAHFEEPNPRSTFARLRRLGVPVEVIRSSLKWLDLDNAARYADDLRALDQAPSLVILDGVVAACAGRSINDDETVSWFRLTYVNPAAKLGAAVLGLHHPVKDPNRRGERGGRGSGSWINLVDGVHFQAMPGKVWIGRGRKGWIDLYADKDREGSVVDGAPDGRESGWRVLGRLEVEDQDDKVSALLVAPGPEDQPTAPRENKVRELAEQIEFVLELPGHDGRYPSDKELRDWLRARDVVFRNDDLGPALQWLEDQGRLDRGPVVTGRPRPGWLTRPIPGEVSQTAPAASP